MSFEPIIFLHDKEVAHSFIYFIDYLDHGQFSIHVYSYFNFKAIVVAPPWLVGWGVSWFELTGIFNVHVLGFLVKWFLLASDLFGGFFYYYYYKIPSYFLRISSL